jgi:VanZ family protein
MTLLLALVWAGAFALTHIPAKRMPRTHVSDKTLHVVGYAGLTGLFLPVLAMRGATRGRQLLIAALALPLYAAVDELTQPLVNRHGSLTDWFCDVLGVAVGMGLYLCAAEILARRRDQYS